PAPGPPAAELHCRGANCRAKLSAVNTRSPAITSRPACALTSEANTGSESPSAVAYARERLVDRQAHSNATHRKGSLRGKRLNMDKLARLLAFGPHAGEYAGNSALLHVDMARIDGSGQGIGAP